MKPPLVCRVESGNCSLARQARAAVALVVLAVPLVACGVLPGQKGGRQTHTYLLQWEPDGGPSHNSPAPCPTLLITAPRSAPGFAGGDMVYVQQDHRVDHFARNRWADSPANMIEPLLMRAMEHTGLFEGVVQVPSPVPVGLRLDTRVLVLRQLFDNGSSEVELSIRVGLVNMKDRRMVFNRVLTVAEPAPEATPYGGVVAANRALAQLFENLEKLLQQYLLEDGYCKPMS